jgi:hypothetical protein
MQHGSEIARPGCRLQRLVLHLGNLNTVQNIFCDGLRLDITQNLYAALWQLREDDRTQPLWADAVCINQLNTPEKTAQVRVMREIYEQANLVISWLGNATETDEAGISLIRTIYDRFGAPSLDNLGSISFAQGNELRLPGIEDPV